MGRVSQEILDILTGKKSASSRMPASLRSDELLHIGRSVDDGAPGPGSGRYPKGSGENPNQHRSDLLDRIEDLKKKGITKEIDIARALGFKNTNDFRPARSLALAERKATRVSAVRAMLADGKNISEIAREFGTNESSVRSWLNEKSIARSNTARATADFLRDQVDEKGIIEVGAGTELYIPGLNVSKGKFAAALTMLEDEGYIVYDATVPTGAFKNTNFKVLCPPGTERRETYDYDNIHTIVDFTCRENADGNDVFEKKFEYPASLDSSRLLIRYRDDVLPDGHKAIEKDGVIEIRRGVPDLDLGDSHYAQVRILVDGDKYLKGMAMYSDDLPAGIDIAFNSNKKPGTDVLKPIKKADPNDPFGALLREEGGQYHYDDPVTGERKLGLINKTRQEGDWEDWSDTLPSQFLSKQPQKLIDTQLKKTMEAKAKAYQEILSLTNPTVRRYFLEEFASSCDSDAVELKAVSLPRQAYHVLLPVPTLKDNEVYAPNYDDGEKIALIRFPHAGLFEIPILTNNTHSAEGRSTLGSNPIDAIGVNYHNLNVLSGADCDGDTVLTIPCNTSGNKVHIQNRPPFAELADFDNKLEYGPSRVEQDPKYPDDPDKKIYYRDGHQYSPLKKSMVGREMGEISNLITDMTLRGAPDTDIVKAVRHSMVVIDAEKHHLDYRQSAIDNNIAQLKKEYQEHFDEDGNPHYSASTLISRAKGEVHVDPEKGTRHINYPGKPWYDPNKPVGAELVTRVPESYVDKKTGKTVERKQKSTQMAETDDAYTLSSGLPQEEAYAAYANYMKALANEARKTLMTTPRLEYHSSAAQMYRDEVENLVAQLRLAQRNSPRERKAQQATASYMKVLCQDNPDLTKKEKKKYRQIALKRFREQYHSKRHKIDISERQWEAIQAGAISDSKLNAILQFADTDKIRRYAMPRPTKKITKAQEARARALANNNYTNAQIAEALGISKSAVSDILTGTK